MIRIEYRRGVRLKRYEGMLKKTEHVIDAVVADGYVGNKKEMTVAVAKSIFYRLDATGRSNLMNVAPAGICSMTDTDKVKIPSLYLDTDTTSFLKSLQANGKQTFKELTHCKAKDLENLIDGIEKKYPVLAQDKAENDPSKRSNLYQVIYHVFVTNGYGEMKGKSRFYYALGIDVCPYCNRNRIRPFTRNKATHVTGELDHFYCKEKYPYLALTRENLVPSCSVCNGTSGKHNGDYYKSGLVNPFALAHSHEFTFGLDITYVPEKVRYENLASLLKIEFNFQSNRLKKNCDVFNWRQLYRQEEYKKLASNIYWEASTCAVQPYQEQVVTIISGEMDATMADVFYHRNHVSPYEEDYLKGPDSKFIVDIFKDVLQKAGGRWMF